MQLKLEFSDELYITRMKEMRRTWTDIQRNCGGGIPTYRWNVYALSSGCENWGASQGMKRRLKTNDCWQHGETLEIFNLAHWKTLSKFFGRCSTQKSHCVVCMCKCIPVWLSFAFWLKWWSLFVTPHWEYIFLIRPLFFKEKGWKQEPCYLHRKLFLRAVKWKS